MATPLPELRRSGRPSLVARLRLRYGRPVVWLSLLLILVLAYLVVVPLGQMVLTSVRWDTADLRLSREAEPGRFTFFHWQRVLKSPLSAFMFYEPLRNTIVVAVGSSVLALILGIALAWLLTRTDVPGQRWLKWLAPLPYMMPSWYLALAWIVVFKNDRIGGATGLFQHLSGAAPPDWISYGPLPIIITLGIHLYPFVYLLVSGALASVDSSLEEAALVQGASRGYILRRITLPLVMPAIFSSFILAFSRALGTFGTPSFLGLPVSYYTLPTMIYSNLKNRQAADAFVIVVFLIALAGLTIFVNQLVIGKRKGYATITGKGLTVRRTKLGRARWPITVLLLVFYAVAVALPFILLAWQSLMKVEGDYRLSNLTLAYWIGRGSPRVPTGLFRSAEVGRVLWNTLRVALFSGLICAFSGLLIGYAVVRLRGRWLSRLLEQASFLPYLIPSIAFGAVYLAMFSRPLGPLPSLYGSLTLLVLVSAVKYLPMAARSGTSAMMQVAQDLEEAATVQGAGWWRRFWRVLLPLTREGAVTGFLFTFISAMKELSLVVILVTPATATLNTLTYRYAEQGFGQFSDVIILTIVFFILVANFVARSLGGERAGHRLGG
ncbi:MAG: ABC transporter permease [Methanocella sp.]